MCWSSRQLRMGRSIPGPGPVIGTLPHRDVVLRTADAWHVFESRTRKYGFSTTTISGDFLRLRSAVGSSSAFAARAPADRSGASGAAGSGVLAADSSVALLRDRILRLFGDLLDDGVGLRDRRGVGDVVESWATANGVPNATSSVVAATAIVVRIRIPAPWFGVIGVSRLS